MGEAEQNDVVGLLRYGPYLIGVSRFDIRFIYICIICGCLGFWIMFLKATINKSVFMSIDVGYIGQTT